MIDNQAQLRHLLETYCRDTLGLPNWQQSVEGRLRVGLRWQLQRLQAFVSTEGERVLDVGCGLGDLLMALEAEGSVDLAVGVEPDFQWAREARHRTSAQAVEVSVAVGERLPFPANSFDGVCSNFVVEHVADLDAALAEMLRVCAPGGWCYINGPNYLVPYEPHYRMLMLPWLPRWLAEWYLQRSGRDPSYFRHHIHYVNPFIVLRSLRRLGIASELNLVQQSLVRPELFASEFVRKWARRINWLPWPSWLVHLLSPAFSILVWKPEK
jgi:ubiquinone/menaquinone biosynthesis C-methylase UbiE